MASQSDAETRADLQALSIVVLSYNRRPELEKNIPYLCGVARTSGCQLIVVDNASTDGSGEFLTKTRDEYSELVVIQNDRNAGVSGGRNLGWRAADRPWILNIDDDTQLSEADIFHLLSAGQSDETIGILSPRIVHAETGKSQCDFGSDVVRTANFHGACHLVRREVFARVGELDPECSFGGEELDYSIRARCLGFDIVYAPVTTVRHNNFERSGDEGEWRRRQWIFNYTRVLFKHFPMGMALLFAFRSLLSHVVSGLRTRGVFFAASLSRPFLKGVWAGRRSHHTIPGTVVAFYSNPTLTPEFGNVPLWKKLSFARSLAARTPR